MEVSRALSPVVLPHGDEETAVLQPVGVVMLPGDRVAIVDQFSLKLHVFDADGTHRGSAGGKGSGPGEMQSVLKAFSAGGDSVALWDPILRRLSIFSGEPKFVRTELGAERRHGLLIEPHPIGRFADGRFVVLEEVHPMAEMDLPLRGDPVVQSRRIRAGFDSLALVLELPAKHIVVGGTQNQRRIWSADDGRPRAVAVCERGLVVLHDSTLTAYDTALRPIAEFAVALETYEMTGDQRRQSIESLASMGPTASPTAREDAAMLMRVQPDPLRMRNTPLIAANGTIWRSRASGPSARQVYLRSSLDGAGVDTIGFDQHGFPLAASDRLFVLQRMDEDTVDAATLVFRASARPSVRDATPDLGRCSRQVSY